MSLVCDCKGYSPLELIKINFITKEQMNLTFKKLCNNCDVAQAKEATSPSHILLHCHFLELRSFIRSLPKLAFHLCSTVATNL